MKTIYNDSISEYLENYNDDVLEFLKNNDIDPTPNNKEDAAQFLIDSAADDLYAAINYFDNVNKYDSIKVIANFGLWYGRRKANATFKTLKEAFYKCVADNNKVYFKKANTTLLLKAYHHDGCNCFAFYKVVNNKKYAIKLNDLF